MAGSHAVLSPSSAERWLNCPASVRAIADAGLDKSDEGSAYAQEGTLAHELAEIRAGLYFELITPAEFLKRMAEWQEKFEAEDYPEGTEAEVAQHVTGYLDFLAERVQAHPNSQLALEQKLDTGVPRSWGTSDAVIFSPTHVEAVDFKYGAGVAVSAYGNPQLRLYGLGALDAFGDLLGDTETVTATIYQPRRESVSSETLTADELRAWRENVAIPAALLTEDPDAPFGPSEDACRWCPLKGICRARAEAVVEQDFGTPPDTLSNEQLAEPVGMLGMIRAWRTDVETTALEKLYQNGETLPGWKTVLSGGKRSIVNPAEAVRRLQEAGYELEKVADVEPKPKTLGALEKLVGKAKLPEILGDTLRKGEGKPSLAPESDKREAVTATSSAADIFEEEPAA